MKLLDWLKTPAETGIKNAISKTIELAIISTGTVLGGYVLTFLAARFSELAGASKRFALYEVVIWALTAAAGAILVTFSFMRSKLRHIERKANDELQQSQQKARELSETDYLTGLGNLRALNDEWPKAIEEARKKEQPLTLAIFDIDGFGEVNRQVGHEKANKILREVADQLKPRGSDKLFRYPDDANQKPNMVFRYGGDEFIVIAFNTNIGGRDADGKPVNVAAGMARALRDNVWRLDNYDLAAKRRELNLPPKVTVSAGLADADPCRDTGDVRAELTNHAELALVNAKERNAKIGKSDDSFKGTIVSYDGEYHIL